MHRSLAAPAAAAGLLLALAVPAFAQEAPAPADPAACEAAQGALDAAPAEVDNPTLVELRAAVEAAVNAEIGGPVNPGDVDRLAELKVKAEAGVELAVEKVALIEAHLGVITAAQAAVDAADDTIPNPDLAALTEARDTACAPDEGDGEQAEPFTVDDAVAALEALDCSAAAGNADPYGVLLDVRDEIVAQLDDADQADPRLVETFTARVKALGYCDGTGGEQTTDDQAAGTGDEVVAHLYDDCADVIAADAAPLLATQDGYRDALDSDGDGVACEITTTPAPTSTGNTGTANAVPSGSIDTGR